MGDPIKVDSGSSYSGYETEPGHAERPQENETLEQMAQRLGVDPDGLAEANSQVKDPKSTILSPFQQIEVPDKLYAQPPKEATDSPSRHGGQSHLPPRPTSDPESASGMKARLWAVSEDKEKQQSTVDYDPVSRPDEGSSEWEDQQNDLDQVCTPNRAAIAWQQEENERLEAQQKLHDLGLPPDPPKITTGDLARLKVPVKEPETEKVKDRIDEAGFDLGLDAGYHVVLHVAEHTAAHIATSTASIGVATEAGLAADSLELMSGVGTVAAIVGYAKGLYEIGSDMRAAKREAIENAEDGAATIAEGLVREQFPQNRPLNERGKEQIAALVEKWKDATSDKINDAMRHLQMGTVRWREGCLPHGMGMGASNACVLSDEEQAKVIAGAKAEITRQLIPATVELANEEMKVYYDPRNWDESKTGAQGK